MKEMLNRRAFVGVTAALAGTQVLPVFAAGPNDYPDRAIRVLIGTPPGDTADGWVRRLTANVSTLLKQPIIIDNRPGAHGMIVGTAAKTAPKDGYTLLASTGGPMSINPSVYKDKLTYDPVKDFVPIAPVVRGGLFLYCRADLPVNDVKQMVAYVKERRGNISYGSGGNGTTQHLTMELLKSATGMEMQHVPYRGSPMVLQDVMGGQIAFAFDAGGSLLPQVRSGRVKVLAVTGQKRFAELPDVPTFAELNLPVDSRVWMGIFAPAGTPPDVVARLEEAISKSVADPEFARYLAAAGAEPWVGTSSDLQKFLAADIARWAPIVKAAGVRPE